ncbi:uncharacterized protein BDZ99DRAFT_459529 [Mytilinidion resinicola]|uniref:Uncharacterized protein n=1 Tax=Mytilinidion resinicola TaxID=574789 RepID=A0A6A6YZ06_9PEZI|nr:uncharacterized protein BDZ99DRAFT_459529 [Mytilinidion resinicola]KAF2813778.1 hypothetical protein BDZ99DRAFT_459529 [Mytilinidion resinicola]
MDIDEDFFPDCVKLLWGLTLIAIGLALAVFYETRWPEYPYANNKTTRRERDGSGTRTERGRVREINGTMLQCSNLYGKPGERRSGTCLLLQRLALRWATV